MKSEKRKELEEAVAGLEQFSSEYKTSGVQWAEAVNAIVESDEDRPEDGVVTVFLDQEGIHVLMFDFIHCGVQDQLHVEDWMLRFKHLAFAVKTHEKPVAAVADLSDSIKAAITEKTDGGVVH